MQPDKDAEQGEQEDPVRAAYPVGVVSEALEREEALLAHLNETATSTVPSCSCRCPVQTQLDMLRSRRL